MANPRVLADDTNQTTDDSSETLSDLSPRIILCFATVDTSLPASRGNASGALNHIVSTDQHSRCGVPHTSSYCLCMRLLATLAMGRASLLNNADDLAPVHWNGTHWVSAEDRPGASSLDCRMIGEGDASGLAERAAADERRSWSARIWPARAQAFPPVSRPCSSYEATSH